MRDSKSIKSRYTMSQGNQRSSNSMKRCKNLELIPTDLIMEIFSRLPSKTIGRFSCVSKLWGSMLRSPYFTKLFSTRSSAHPRLLFAVEGDGEWLFYSLPQPQNHPYEKKSLVVAADYHTKFRGQMYRDEFCASASGLVHFHNFVWTSKEDRVPMICHPITGQYVTLPKLDCDSTESTSYLGFDPIDKQFKILAEVYPFYDHHKILTLGTGKLRWRKNSHCPGYNSSCDGICINGILYYLAKKDGDNDDVIVCFDVRSEKFKFIESEYIEFFDQLINYKGKLCGIELANGDADDDSDSYSDDDDDDDDDYDTDSIQLRMWVLEDVEKQKWSKYIYTLPENQIPDVDFLYVAGVTVTSDIVLAILHSSNSKPFYVFYFSPERNTLLSIEIQGFGANLKDVAEVHTFVNYVEDLGFIDAKQLKSSISAPPGKKKKKKSSRNIIPKKVKTTTSGRGKKRKR